jgi:hypothetical protein
MMMRRGTLLLTALVTLLFAPAICGSGWAILGCDHGHENDCPADPCNTVALDGGAVVKSGSSVATAEVDDPPVERFALSSPLRPSGAATAVAPPGPTAALPLRC